MVIFWRLLFGHLLADFTFQTDFINRWKRQSVWGLLVHSAMHPAFYIVLTWPYLRETWVDLGFVTLSGWACLLVIFISHFVEDWWRVYTIVHYHTPDNTLYFAWDQIIHYAVIFAVIPVGLRNPNVTLMPEDWPVLGCLFVVATHATTIIVYFIEKDLYGRAFPDAQEKYLSMLERLILALIFLTPGNLWPLLALGWFSVMHHVRKRRYLDLSWFSLYLGGALAALCGLAARFVYFS